jgi:hypothetical protein
MILESTIGGIVGGVFRLIPEGLKLFDRKNERAHELAMLEAEMKFAGMRADHEMRKIDASMTISEMDAIGNAIKEQGQTARAAGGFVSAISALVRPLVTYWFVMMYSAVKIVTMTMAVSDGADWKAVLIENWTEEDMALLVMVLTFWFVGRVYERTRK